MANSVVNVVDSEDEDAQQDLLFRRRLYLKKARAVASNRRTKGRMLLEALERPAVSQLHVSDLLELAEANVPHQGASTTSVALSRTIVPESPLSSPVVAALTSVKFYWFVVCNCVEEQKYVSYTKAAIV